MSAVRDVQAKVDALNKTVLEAVQGSGPDAKGLADRAVLLFEEGRYLVHRALAAVDYLPGDDGGRQGPDRSQPALREFPDEADFPTAPEAKVEGAEGDPLDRSA